nr:hypothetical protein [Tanacetum cinerariifolium]
MDIVAERAARKAAKSDVQSSLKPSPVAGDGGRRCGSEEKVDGEEDEKRLMRRRMKKRVLRRRMKKRVMRRRMKKKVDEEEDEGEDEEDAIVKDEEYKEEEKEKVSEEEEEEEDVKRLGRKKRKKDSEPSSSEDEKLLKKKTKGRKKGKGPRQYLLHFFHAIRGAKVNMKSFKEDIGFYALHSVNIDTLPNRLARFVVRAFDSKTYNFYLKTGVVHVTVEKVHEILGLPIGGISLYDLPERREDDEFVQLWLSQFAPKKKKRIFATDIAEKLLLYHDSIKFYRFLIIRSKPAIKSWITKNMSTRQYLEIEDEAFGKLEFYGEWSENETVEAEGFCEYASVLRHTDKKIVCEMIEEKLSSISKEKAEVENLLRDANKEFPNDDNVKQLFEQYKGFFKETVLLKEAKAQKAPQNVKPKPAAVNTKEAAEKPKPAENVKEFQPKEQAEKVQKAPQNIKPKPAAMKTKEAAEKPKPAENPKPAAVKTKEAAEKPMSTENVKELAEKPKEPAGDDYQVVRAATVMKAEDREEFEVETFTQWLEGNIDWVGDTLALTLWIDANDIDCWVALLNFEELALGYPTPTRHFFPTGRINQGFIKGTLTEEEQWKLFYDEIKAQFKYEHSSMSLSDFELVFFSIYASDHFYVVVFNIKMPKTMVILDNSDSGYTYASKYKEACDPLKKLFSRYLKEQNHLSYEAVAKTRPFIPKLKWRTSNNHVDCGVFAMIHMENYVGDAAKNWEFGLCEESDEQLSMLQRMRYNIATKIMLHQFNAVSNKMFDFAFTFETKNTEQARVSMIVDAIKNKNNRDPPKQVKETDVANVVVGVNEVVDQVKEKRRRKK